jgi:hypothetical protein
MLRTPKISLAIPHAHVEGRVFSLKLQKTIEEENSVFRRDGDILIVSDIEGNFESFIKILIKATVINKYFKWTFGKGHLVILGDCFDRGQEVIECLWLIYSLEEQARAANGHVHFILGNHEIMNMNGDWRYIHPKYAAGKPGTKFSVTALYDGNNELWRWLRTKNIVERIGSILLVHGGISRRILDLRMSLEEINLTARLWYHHAYSLSENQIAWKLLNGEDSPIWYRGYYFNQADENLIDETLKFYQAKTIVTGHSMLDKVTGFFNNKVINVDTDHANGISEALLIRKERYFRVGRLINPERIK